MVAFSWAFEINLIPESISLRCPKTALSKGDTGAVCWDAKSPCLLRPAPPFQESLVLELFQGPCPILLLQLVVPKSAPGPRDDIFLQIFNV